MTIGAGEDILAADIQAIKDDVDKLTDAARDNVGTSETTTSTAYTDLATAGPSVTITTGTRAIVFWVVRMSNDGANGICHVSYEVSGATTDAADDANAITFQSDGAGQTARMGASRLLTGLTAGSNTFTLKYRVNANTGTFLRREIAVLPIGA